MKAAGIVVTMGRLNLTTRAREHDERHGCHDLCDPLGVILVIEGARA
jgi:hypothetical protein